MAFNYLQPPGVPGKSGPYGGINPQGGLPPVPGVPGQSGQYGGINPGGMYSGGLPPVPGTPGQSGQYGGINPGGGVPLDLSIPWTVSQPGKAAEPATPRGLHDRPTIYGLGGGAGGPQTIGDPAQGYTADNYRQWYTQTYGTQPTDAHMADLGVAVGPAAGPNGNFSADQWAQGQQFGQQSQQSFFPEFDAPTYEAGPAYSAPDPFSYEAFQAPSAEQAMQDPGFQFGLQQGIGALMGSKAAQGLARTGATGKALVDYGQQAAKQHYGDVYNRAYQTWAGNRANAADAYAQNYQIGRDAWRDNEAMRQGAFDRNYQGASDAFNAQFRGRELTFEDLFRRWQTGLNINTQLALAD